MYFSDVFGVSTDLLTANNLFDISLVSDLPLFIDPFLIFDGENPEYQQLHDSIIKYVKFVRDKAVSGSLTQHQKKEWLCFPEIPNNWLGFSIGSNRGRGLGSSFAQGAILGLTGPVSDFGKENFSRGSHVEKLFLFSSGNGKDALSDFMTNLCHEYLLINTERFARQQLDPKLCREFNVRRVRFDYEKERWVSGNFFLPAYNHQYVLLTPINLLTQSVAWINRPDLFEKFGGMLKSIGNTHLRQSINNFLKQKLASPPNHPKNKEYVPPRKDVQDAYARALKIYPDIANWYVSVKEDDGERAFAQSKQKVDRAADLYRSRVVEFVSQTLRPTGFFNKSPRDTQELISLFSKAISEAGKQLFLGDQGLLNSLTTDDVRLICTLAWRGDGNEERVLPHFRFVYDSKSTTQFESGLREDSLVVNQFFRTTSYGTVGEQRLDESDFVRTGTFNHVATGRTIAIDQQHDLGTLATFCLPYAKAPFLADENVPSAMDSSRSISPCRSSLLTNRAHAFLKRPDSDHCFSRRQHVGCEGKWLGKSRHRAPVRKIQTKASKQSRDDARGRPGRPPQRRWGRIVK